MKELISLNLLKGSFGNVRSIGGKKNESNVISQYQSCILGKIWGKVVEMLPYEHE